MSGSAALAGGLKQDCWWRIISCLKAELVFAENQCHLIDDQLCVLLCHGGPGSSTSLQGVRLSPTLQYNILFVRVYSMLQTFYLKSQFTSAILKYMSCWALLMHFRVTQTFWTLNSLPNKPKQCTYVGNIPLVTLAVLEMGNYLIVSWDKADLWMRQAWTELML